MKTLQEQIDEFYKETGYQLKVKDGKPYYDDCLFLSCRNITKLPDNLVVRKCLYLRYSNVTKLPDNLVVGGFLNLTGTNITELPEGLVVGGYLDLRHTKITELPENLVVGGSLYLGNTKVTELPDNLVVGGSLYLKGSKITELPDNLVVGGNLDLYGTEIIDLSDNLVVGGYLNISCTKITKLPDNLVVGTSLYLRDTDIIKVPDSLIVGGSFFINNTKITELPDNLVVGDGLSLYHTDISKLPENLVVGSYLNLYDTKIVELPDSLIVGGRIFGVPDTPITPTLTKEAKKKIQKIKGFLQWNVGAKTYIKVDDIFSVVDNHKGNVWVTHQVGNEEILYVVTDDEGHYAHGNTLKEAKADLIYKINDRDTSLYENLSLDNEVSFEEAIAMYRTITGACSAGTRNYIENRLPTPHKEKYSIKEIITLTAGEYGSETFKNFFGKKK